MEACTQGPINKVDEALEIKALRRVINAYLNYSNDAEEDVRRWERSYSKLPNRHKDLLSHLPKKYDELRRCISTNSEFISSMLQAFEPPFEMSYSGGCYGEDHQRVSVHHCDKHAEVLHQDMYPCSHGGRQTLENGSTSGKQSEKCGERNNGVKTRNDCATSNSRDVQEGMRDFDSDASDETHGNSGISKKHSVATCPPSLGVTQGLGWLQPTFQSRVPPSDVDKVRCIIRNIVRDWAKEGAFEREKCYAPILEELELWFPLRDTERRPSCLVPGAGLGRLACEISRLGFVSQGNEFSYYMLICSSFILNFTQGPLEWVIHPWIHSNCNKLTDEHQLQAIQFPDLHPGSAGITEGFSMCAGDFIEVYSHPSQIGAWDAVATCFFIDTAHNIVEYIEIISIILKPGGVWINLGPLLYHFADAYAYSPEDEMSVELSLEDVKKVASFYGLKMKKEQTIQTTYTANSNSMMQNQYFAAFWTMVKEDVSSSSGIDTESDLSLMVP